MEMPTFERRVSKQTIGCPKPFNACADPIVCNGMGLYLHVERQWSRRPTGGVANVRMPNVSPSRIACRVISGRTLDSVRQLNVEAFAAAGGDVVNDLQIISVRVLLAVEMALVDHEVKRVLAAAVGQEMEAHPTS